VSENHELSVAEKSERDKKLNGKTSGGVDEKVLVPPPRGHPLLGNSSLQLVKNY
jgi:hypothetical protein